MPTTEKIAGRVDQHTSRWGAGALRWLAGLLWLSNVSWKVPGSFGETAESCRGLCRFVQMGVDHPVLPGSDRVFESVIQPNLAAFGWFTLLAEATLAVLFLSGRCLRTAGVLGIVVSAGILVAVSNSPEEWYWSYGLMVALSFAIIVLAPSSRPTSSRAASVLLAAYGVVVAVAHAGAGFTGDGNSEWTLFGGSGDIPHDFGRNVFPGSIALGVVLIAVAVGLWFLAEAPPEVRRIAGWVGVGVALVLLLTYGSAGLLLGLGSRASTAVVLAAAFLTLVPGRNTVGPARTPEAGPPSAAAGVT